MSIKPMNLLSLINAKEDLSEGTFEDYLTKMGVNIKLSEVDDISSLVENIKSTTEKRKIFNEFYVGFTINQIGKEFDLIRLGSNYTVNIELKKKNTGDKIHKQLLKNRYYLNALEKEVFNFTYVVEEEVLYFLEKESSLIEVEFDKLIVLLSKQDILEVDNINNLFDPSNYLVSPFNSTERFMANEYFLTTHQDSVKDELMAISSKSENKLFSIEGAAGTGKTLLIYDMAKKYTEEGKKVALIHCGRLNNGHSRLINNYSWNIVPIKHYKSVLAEEYDLIIIDEVQRIYKRQLEDIIENVKGNQTTCIFSYDPKQCLHADEIRNNIPGKLESVVNKTFKLTEKIRTNTEITAFIKNLFDLSKQNPQQTYSNIDIQYFSDIENAKGYIHSLKLNGWTAINYTLSSYKRTSLDNIFVNADENAHSVIGQEYDNVIAIIGNSFSYNDEGKLIGDWRSYYHPTKMLFQILTRTRKKLNLVIVNNETLLKKCMEITG
ncbi:DNA/RNA helicase domain-containing protein [Rossellomorea sp. FM04394]|uniref:DNA/RNA helicase domain-containing protein n=1 Tax=Rossellomorea sp. FM04394 TaxID=3243076 RepID=UPI0035A63AFD